MFNTYKKYGTGIVVIIVSALSYFVTAKLSLLLAIPPGFASPIWPAAGIAVVCALLLGYRATPGIILGSYLANLDLTTSTDLSPIVQHLLALGIATGAGIQAVISALLIERFSPITKSLQSEKNQVLLVLLVGPVGCLINATCSVSLLHLVGLIERSEFSFNWFTWWVGDSIGAAVVTPVLLLLFSPTHITKVLRKILVTIPLLLIFSMVTFTFIWLRDYENNLIKNELKSTANQETIIIKEVINALVLLQDSLKNLFLITDHITYQEFETFTQTILASYPSIQAIEWVPYILHKDRQSFEKQRSEENNSSFKVTEFDSSSNVITALERDDYFPVLYINPLEGNEKTLGFDLASSSLRLNAIQQSITNNQIIATEPIDLIQGNRGLILINPVIKNEKIKGLVISVINSEKFFQSTIEKLKYEDLKLTVIDQTDMNHPILLFGQLSNKVTPFDYQNSLSIANREWNLIFTPEQAFYVRFRPWTVWGTMIAGMMFSLLLEVFLIAITGRAEFIEKTVIEKTKALHDSEQRLRGVVTTILDGLITVDKVGVIESCNPAVEKMFSSSKKKIIGKNIKEFIHDYDFELYFNQLNHETGIQFESTIYSESNDEIPVDLSISKLELHGETYLNTIIRDITARKNASVEQNRLIARLIESNEDLERFAFIASHDLQEPLRMISSFSELLQNKYHKKLDTEGIKYLDICAKSSKQLLKLINDLMLYSKIGRDNDNITEIDTHAVFDLVCKDLLPFITHSNAEITCDPMPRIKANPNQFFSILHNLVSNAIKYRNKNRPLKIHVGVEEKKNEWIFSVKDNGIGIKSDYKLKIFQPFLRLHTLNDFPGTGIGLSICRKIIQNMGGKIWMESQIDKETTFFFTIPKTIINKQQAST